jgi:subtilisin family serine protease
VAATDQNDNLTSFSNYGVASVDVAAPGENVYSTIPEFTSGIPVVLYTEDFDPFPSGWVSGGTNSSWNFVPGTGDGGSNSLEDSPGGNYLNNTDSFAGFAGSGTPFSPVKDNYYTLSFRINAELETGFDFLYLAFSIDGTTWSIWDLDNIRTGSTSGLFVDDSFNLTAMADLLSGFYFGFGLYSDISNTQDGVYIDNLELYREPIIISSYGYDYYPGTSQASPHVAGVAGLVKAQNPNYTHLQIRDAIFNTVDSLSSLSGQISTGGRINAFKAVTYIAPPPNFSASAGNGSVTLNWNANSESAVTGYIVAYGETTALGTEIDVGDVATYEISGLTNGITYHFTVHAVGDFPVIGSIGGTNSNIVTATPIGPPVVGGGGGGGGGG